MEHKQINSACQNQSPQTHGVWSGPSKFALRISDFYLDNTQQPLK